MCKMLIKVPNHEFSERFPIDVLAIFKAVCDPAFPMLSAWLSFCLIYVFFHQPHPLGVHFTVNYLYLSLGYLLPSFIVGTMFVPTVCIALAPLDISAPPSWPPPFPAWTILLVCDLQYYPNATLDIYWIYITTSLIKTLNLRKIKNSIWTVAKVI